MIRPERPDQNDAHYRLRRGLGLSGVALGFVLVLLGLAPAISGDSHTPPLRAADSTRHVGAQTHIPTSAIPAMPSVQNHQVAVAGPRRILVPDIGLAATMVPLDVRPDGTLETPKDFAQAGWYANGPEPGEPGPAVIVGHVDSRVGPAVFFRIPEMRPGHRIMVEATSGHIFTFVVDRVERFSKQHFPTAEVYGHTMQPVLRLITCGGTFNRAAGSYPDNIVVFARLTG